MTTDQPFWRRCSSCKRELRFDSPYWICSVSTCNRKGSSFVFCSVGCWNAHVPTMRHRESWAEEQRSPTRVAWATQATEEKPSTVAERVSPVQSGDAPTREVPSGDIPREVLIIASKLKQYVRARSGMNTSDSVMEVLSRRVRALCDDAILRAREEGRKTLMDRDF